MGAIWNETQQLLSSVTGVLAPFREDMENYFEWVKEEKARERAAEGKPSNSSRRPTIGLRLELDGGAKTLAIRPAWRPAGTYHRLDGIVNDPARFFPGDINPAVVTLELLGPGKLLSMKLVGAEAKLTGSVSTDMSVNSDRLSLVLKTAHRLMKDPWEAFASQADRCVCCGRKLKDIVSRSRGIGPECITYFKHFEQPSPTVADYRAKYRSIDDPWEISTPLIGNS